MPKAVTAMAAFAKELAAEVGRVLINAQIAASKLPSDHPSFFGHAAAALRAAILALSDLCDSI